MIYVEDDKLKRTDDEWLDIIKEAIEKYQKIVL